MTFLNVHGFMGEADNKNSKALAVLYPHAALLSPQIDYLKQSPTALLDCLSKMIEEQMREGNTPILVGQSLGGWAAEQLSYKYALPCLLTNPCLDPHLCGVIVDSPIPRDFLKDYAARSMPKNNPRAFTLCTKTDEVLGEENFDRCALLGGWLREVKGRHSKIENLEGELQIGLKALLEQTT
ncbi:MAG: hypothetical protein IJX08_05390 [Clostridia bacterium]|nr:hypothetical protein [Clostridia bacterium]